MPTQETWWPPTGPLPNREQGWYSFVVPTRTFDQIEVRAHIHDDGKIHLVCDQWPLSYYVDNEFELRAVLLAIAQPADVFLGEYHA